MRAATASPGLRGPVAAALVAALAVAAHGAAGGGWPSSTEFGLLQAVSILTGAIAAAVRMPRGRAHTVGPHRGGSASRGGRRPILPGSAFADAVLLIAVLAGGQFAAHAVLAGPGHAGPHDLSATMLAAHSAATLLVALAIPAAERVAVLAASTLRALLGPPAALAAATQLAGFPGAPLLRAAGPLGASGPRAPPHARPPLAPSTEPTESRTPCTALSLVARSRPRPRQA